MGAIRELPPTFAKIFRCPSDTFLTHSEKKFAPSRFFCGDEIRTLGTSFFPLRQKIHAQNSPSTVCFGLVVTKVHFTVKQTPGRRSAGGAIFRNGGRPPALSLVFQNDCALSLLPGILSKNFLNAVPLRHNSAPYPRNSATPLHQTIDSVRGQMPRGHSLDSMMSDTTNPNV